MISIQQHLAPGLLAQDWADSREGEAFFRNLRPVVTRLKQEADIRLSVTRQLQAPPDTDMDAVSQYYAQALGTGYARSDTQLDALTATVWQHKQQALLLAFTREVFDFGRATPSRLVFLASTPAP